MYGSASWAQVTQLTHTKAQFASVSFVTEIREHVTWHQCDVTVIVILKRPYQLSFVDQTELFI